MNFSTDMDPVSMGCCRLFPDLLETDTDVCFVMIVKLTLVILLSWLFTISAFCPNGDVIETQNIRSHRKPSSYQLSQGVPICFPPKTPQHMLKCQTNHSSHFTVAFV